VPQIPIERDAPNSIVADALNDNFDELYSGEGGKFPIVTDASTARSLGLGDNHKYIRFTSAAPVTVTVPPQSEVEFRRGDEEIIMCQAGAGQVTIAAGAGVTINTPATRLLKTAEQFAVVTLKRVAADEWDLIGNQAEV
jgi:hypothetical protein